MNNAIWSTERYFDEGHQAFIDGTPRHLNPYNYRWEIHAANAWDDGWDTAKLRSQSKQLAMT